MVGLNGEEVKFLFILIHGFINRIEIRMLSDTGT